MTHASQLAQPLGGSLVLGLAAALHIGLYGMGLDISGIVGRPLAVRIGRDSPGRRICPQVEVPGRRNLHFVAAAMVAPAAGRHWIVG